MLFLTVTAKSEIELPKFENTEKQTPTAEPKFTADVKKRQIWPIWHFEMPVSNPARKPISRRVFHSNWLDLVVVAKRVIPRGHRAQRCRTSNRLVASCPQTTRRTQLIERKPSSEISHVRINDETMSRPLSSL